MTLRLLPVLCLFFAAACTLPGGGLRPAANSAPPADAGGKGGVDGLLVGHRLMEANEPELALKAYYRAAAEDGINADVLSAIGSANLALGRLGQAEQVLRRALERDPGFVPALNNLGCVLMEQGKIPEARNVFQQAFALDSGASDSIRENLRLAIARMENPVYSEPEEDQKQEAPNLKLVRRGHGEYVLLSAL